MCVGSRLFCGVLTLHLIKYFLISILIKSDQSYLHLTKASMCIEKVTCLARQCALLGPRRRESELLKSSMLHALDENARKYLDKTNPGALLRPRRQEGKLLKNSLGALFKTRSHLTA